MSTNPANQTWKSQQKRLVRATFKKAFINAVHVSAKTVDVYYAENPQTIIRNIPVADTVNISTVTVGKRCRIDIFDETNPNDMVMAYTY
jgi:hypothetical protein